MKEVEVLVSVLSKKEDALNAMSRFVSQGVKKTLDIYFFDPLRQELKPEADFRLRRAFRLRRKNDKYTVAYKIDHFNDEKDEWIYSDEHETSVGDFDVILSIAGHLGLRELVRIDNEKHTFTTSEYEIVLEDVGGLGLFLEVEKLSEVADDLVDVAKQDIREFIGGLGIQIGGELNAGKPELMLRRNGQVPSK